MLNSVLDLLSWRFSRTFIWKSLKNRELKFFLQVRNRDRNLGNLQTERMTKILNVDKEKEEDQELRHGKTYIHAHPAVPGKSRCWRGSGGKISEITQRVSSGKVQQWLPVSDAAQRSDKLRRARLV